MAEYLRVSNGAIRAAEARAWTHHAAQRLRAPSLDGRAAEGPENIQLTPAVQAVAKLQRALNGSPRVTALTGLSSALQAAHPPVQLSARRDRARLRRAQQNRTLFVRLLMSVVLANLVNRNYVLEDIDDLIEEPDREGLVDEVRRQQELRAERRAQGQEQRDRQRNERRRQRNQEGGYRRR